MKKLFFILIIISGLSIANAQSLVNRIALTQNVKQVFASTDTLRILAVMVEFQEDKYDATIGTGKFGSHYTQTYGDTILDPLPHNAQYFEDHLLFAKNYFKKVSNGKLNISYKVLPEVITVSKMMREYSTAYRSDDFTPLANFSKEVWQLADEKYSNVNFNNYDLFVVFHAGVSNALGDGGGIVNRNIPSLYLSTASLKKYFGNQFVGFTTKSGNISNTLIMSETETREIEQVDGSVYLLQVGINGILVGNIGSHIGLPDLLNTVSSQSAIGRFGLMDSQGMVAYNGIFPPEPSAWEKIYMGWVVPTEIGNLNSRINIATKLTASGSDTTIAKINLNSSEYYLIENREQDANKDNLKLTIKKGSNIYTKTILPDTSGLFYFEPTDLKGGVVIDVDEFDAAVPGNGLVIWHIDEKIIDEKIADNKINADLYNKGVDVEEADGIQDIGEVFTSVLGTAIGEGTNEDLWYKGNKAKLYKNSFSPDSKPNTNTNSGANSLITIDNFSDASNKMGFNLSFNSDGLTRINRINVGNIINPKSIVFSKDVNAAGTEQQFISLLENGNLWNYDTKGNFIRLFNNFSNYELAVVPTSTKGLSNIIGVNKNKVTIAYNGLLLTKELDFTLSLSTPPVVVQSGSAANILVGTDDGNLLTIDYNYLLGKANSEPYKTQKLLNEPLVQIASYNNNIYAISSTQYIFDNGSSFFTIPDSAKSFAFVKKDDGNIVGVVLSKKNRFYVIKNGGDYTSFAINSSRTIDRFTIANTGSNNEINILCYDGSSLLAYSLKGILADNFPLTSLDGSDFVLSPVTADINNDGYTDILTTNTKGMVYSFSGKDKKSILFKLNIGNDVLVSPVLFNYDQDSQIDVTKNVASFMGIDKNNSLSLFTISTDSLKDTWTNKYKDFSNNNIFVSTSNSTTSSDYFPLEKAYNWPNPVYGNSTNIRYYVGEDSKVIIRIFDLSGALVETLTANAFGGYENETIWDVSKIQSGVYYANIQVDGINGNSANKNIKIAVIK